jgi:hypothetical protein
LIFIWFGSRIPFGGLVAVRSAVRSCRGAEVLLLHEGLDPSSPGARAIEAEPGVRLERAGVEWFRDLPGGGRIPRRLYEELPSATARSNLLRLAVLWKLGGIYLDMDTIVVRDLAGLGRREGFCGLEHVALPEDLFRSLNPARWAAAGARLAAREACARMDRGVGIFRRMEHRYHLAVNNAVLGSRPLNPFLARTFEEVSAMPPGLRMRRWELGTHLLQRMTGNRSVAGMDVLSPGYFYPLGPEISVHWFRRGSAARLGELLAPETHVVHWYSSVEKRVGVERIDEDYVRQGRDETAFARLASPYLD